MSRFLVAAALALLAFEVHAAEKKRPVPPPEMPLPPVEQLPLPAVPQEQKPAPKPKPEPVAPLAKAVRIGIGVAGDLDTAVAARLSESLRSIAALAPLAREPVALAADRCDADACLATLGVAQQVDRVLFARVSGGVLAIRSLDLSWSSAPADARQPAPADPAELRATAEALACKLLVPAGCTGEAQIDAAGSAIEVDGKPGAARLTLPVGVHALVVRSGDSVLRRPLPVLHEEPFAVALRRSEGRTALLTPEEVAQRAVVASVESPSAPPRRWTRTASYVAAGAGILAAGIGVAEGLRSKSLLNDAESGYRANGNVYRPGDLSNLQSGNSAARTANVLFAAGGVLLASGLVLAFAF